MKALAFVAVVVFSACAAAGAATPEVRGTWVTTTGLTGATGTIKDPATTIANYMQTQGWLLQDSGGNYTNTSNKFSWMNPAVPQVRTFLENIVLDAVKKYDLDGVQFDDRLAWPIQFGYDQTTRNLYQSETG